MESNGKTDWVSLVEQPKITEDRAELAAALAAAQSEIDAAPRTESNTYFKSSYADLATVRAAIREAFGKHGLAVVQIPRTRQGEVLVTTILMHKSGQFIEGTLAVSPVKDKSGTVTPQAIGSAITYARRYSLMAFAGVAPDDDDGNAASQPPQQQQESRRRSEVKSKPEPKPGEAYEKLTALCKKIGCNKEEAEMAVTFCTDGKHTLKDCYESEYRCNAAIDAIAAANRDFPPSHMTPLINQIRDELKEKATT